MSEKSSYWYDSSPVIGTSNQITWAGGDVYCGTTLVACNGTRLTTMQKAILDRICTLEGVIDMTTITFPCSLEVAWNSQDLTILNLIQYLLDNACAQKTTIDSLPTTNDPFVTIEYCCCSGVDGCGTSVTVALSTHIQNIITCLCELKTEVATLTNTISGLATKEQVTDLQNQINCIKGGIIAWNTVLPVFNDQPSPVNNLSAINLTEHCS
jgi:hypothetical protein